MSGNNEDVEIYGKLHGPQTAWAWRRLPDVPDWRVYVHFGDSGYECDPGVYGEPIDSAIEQVAEAVEELTGVLAALKAFKVDDEVKPQ